MSLGLIGTYEDVECRAGGRLQHIPSLEAWNATKNATTWTSSMDDYGNASFLNRYHANLELVL